jgi:hypothetical protein
LKRPTSSSKGGLPARRSKLKSTAKSGQNPVKVKPDPSLYAESALDEPDVPPKGRYARSMAPPPTTPTASFTTHTPGRNRLPKTPLAETGFEPPPEGTATTSHQVHEMLRSLTDIVDTVSLDPKEPSSILHRAKALNAILDTTIIPRMMKVDKDVKDIAWMR